MIRLPDLPLGRWHLVSFSKRRGERDATVTAMPLDRDVCQICGCPIPCGCAFEDAG